MSTLTLLCDEERAGLGRQANQQTGHAGAARRARLILLLESGLSWIEGREKLDCSNDFIAIWSKRFQEERLAGLYSRHAGQPARTLTPTLEARILDWTVTREPPDGSTHWTTRKLGEALGVRT